MSYTHANKAVLAVKKRDGDYIAEMVLKLVKQLVEDATKQPTEDGLEHNIRPEPPEARLGYLPESGAA